jgi:hypothetical protein
VTSGAEGEADDEREIQMRDQGSPKLDGDGADREGYQKTTGEVMANITGSEKAVWIKPQVSGRKMGVDILMRTKFFDVHQALAEWPKENCTGSW